MVRICQQFRFDPLSRSVYAWRERMLDLFDGLVRRTPAYDDQRKLKTKVR